ncbi:MAG: acyl-CoA dehydrogenase [Rhodoferax sp.]|nr:acyl-CoA dehydrogenase [Rhodoferax sp.]
MTHFDSTQTLLRASVQAFNERASGPERLRAVRAQAPHLDGAVWREICDAGWAGVLVPEALGGVGLGPAEAALIALELGRGLAPEPFVACALFPTAALVPLAADSAAIRDLLAALVEGRTRVALAWQEAAGRYDAAAPDLALQQEGTSLRLRGARKCLVPLASAADGFVVSATGPAGPALVWVDAQTAGLRIDTSRTVDGQSTGTLQFEDVVLPAGALLARGPAVGVALAQALDLARLMSAFELIGVLERALESTLTYTKQRVQFGRPIATYQVLQHRMVDMWMQGQLARSAADSALELLCTQAAPEAVALAVSAAKARAASAGLLVGKGAIHLHGAMGIADATNVGLCLKRCLVLSAWLGHAEFQRARYLDLLLQQGRVAEEPLAASAAAPDDSDVDMASLPDEEFRQRLARWIAANYPAHKRFMKKRAFYNDIADWYQALSRKGWLAPAWPKEYGGMGLNAAKQVIYYEEMSRFGCARIPDHGLVMGILLIHHGTPAQRDFHLPRVLSGEHMWCQGYSEPNAGSDLASLRTRAERDGDDLVVNGQKIWTTLAGGANWMFALVRTTASGRSRQAGITFLLIDLRSPGVTIRPIVNLKGEGEYFEVFFDNVRVPVTNVVGEIDQGWSVANSLLRSERIFFGTPRQSEYALGQLDRLAQATNALADGGFRAQYASLVLDVRDLKSAFESFVGRLRAGEELGSEVSYLKVWGTETYQRITDALVQLAGDHGSQMDDVSIDGIQVDVMNQYLDSRAPAIYSGSNEIQRNILAKQILALPSWAGDKA